MVCRYSVPAISLLLDYAAHLGPIACTELAPILLA
jgi:hypothetical protein